jgi:NAD(P)H-flavin reductase
MMDEMHKLQFLYNNFSYKIILSQSDQSQVNRFLYGNISNNLNKIFPDLSNHFIYLGGDDVFINQTKLKVSELGGKKENIYINC